MTAPKAPTGFPQLFDQNTGELLKINSGGSLNVALPSDVVTVTPVLDTSAYADSRILFVPTEIPLALLAAFGYVITIETIQVLDGSNNGTALDLYFLNANTSLGTINNAATMTDANVKAAIIAGPISIATSDFATLATSGATNKTAYLRNVNAKMKGLSTSLWVAALSRGGTPTYAAGDLTFQFGYTVG